MKKKLCIVLAIILSFALFAADSTISSVKKNLLDNKINIIFPTVSATLNHSSQIMSNEVGAHALSDLTKGKISTDLSNLAVVLIRNLSAGDDSLLGAHAGFGGSYLNYGFAFDVNANVDTYASDSVGIDSLNLIAKAKTSLSFAYARHLFDNSLLSVDASVVGHVNSIALNDSISYKKITNQTGNYVKGKAGIGLPIDLETQVCFSNGINCHVDFENLFGIYFLKNYENEKQLASNLFAFGKDGRYVDPWHLNTGVSYSLDYKFIQIAFFNDINNVNTLFNKNFVSNLKRNVDIGVNVNLYDILDVEIGVFGGYFGTNLSVGYNNNRLSVSYGWTEKGNIYGEAPVDHLTIGLTLGWKE